MTARILSPKLSLVNFKLETIVGNEGEVVYDVTDD